MHGKQVFKDSPKFSVDARDLIKSIQFRMTNHAKTFKPNQINHKTQFLARLYGNTNMAFEFENKKLSQHN